MPLPSVAASSSHTAVFSGQCYRPLSALDSVGGDRLTCTPRGGPAAWLRSVGHDSYPTPRRLLSALLDPLPCSAFVIRFYRWNQIRGKNVPRGRRAHPWTPPLNAESCSVVAVCCVVALPQAPFLKDRPTGVGQRESEGWTNRWGTRKPTRSERAVQEGVHHTSHSLYGGGDSDDFTPMRPAPRHLPCQRRVPGASDIYISEDRSPGLQSPSVLAPSLPVAISCSYKI